MVKTIEFDGEAVEYDDSQLNRWSVQKKLIDPAGQFEALDEILCGKSDEVAQRLGDSMERMTELLSRIVAINGNAGKN